MQPQGRPRKPVLLRAFLTAMLVVACLVAAMVYANYRVRESYFDRYACNDIRLLLIAFMASHDGAWPRDWEDLRGVDVEPLRKWGYGIGGSSFEETKRRVEIDFEFKSKSFVFETSKTPRVAWLRGKVPDNANYIWQEVEQYFENPGQFSAMTRSAGQSR